MGCTMGHRLQILFLGVFLLASLFASHTLPRESSSERDLLNLKFRIYDSHSDRPWQPPVFATSTATDTFVLGEFTFDDSLGGPDPQGWMGVDKTAQLGTFFHFDNFAGLSGGYSALEGNQSLWCGARPDTDLEFCQYETLPGYGNSWDQRFESVPFSTSGDVTVNFLVRYDTEPGYDFAFLEYLSKSGQWQTLLAFDGQGEMLASAVIPADSLAGSAKIRFRFESEGAWSDEDGVLDTDGAIIIDSLTVADTNGVVDFQNFEAESPGALTTLDGDWTAIPRPGFGDFFGLFDGSTVLQQDTVVTNTTNLWGFFDGSPDDYSCDGHPEQAVLPFTRSPGSTNLNDYLHNEIWSPFIEFTQDVNGQPIPAEASVLLFEFDIYPNLPLDNLIFYTFRMRFLVAGCPTGWEKFDEFWFGSEQEWLRKSFDFGTRIEPGATHVQLALSARDFCAVWCGVFGSDSCHSQGPLFDNVRLLRVHSVATGIPETPELRATLAQNYPNPFNPNTSIGYTIAESGHVSLKIYSVAGQLVRTLVDEIQLPRENGFTVNWDGKNRSGEPVSSGIYFYRLATKNFLQTKKMVLLR